MHAGHVASASFAAVSPDCPQRGAVTACRLRTVVQIATWIGSVGSSG